MDTSIMYVDCFMIRIDWGKVTYLALFGLDVDALEVEGTTWLGSSGKLNLDFSALHIRHLTEMSTKNKLPILLLQI